MARVAEARFQVKDWREIYTLYPDQWVAIEVEEVTPGVGITKGRIIARGKREDRVASEYAAFRATHPDAHLAIFNTAPVRLKPGEDMILGAY
jgi:hypothetical protein